MKIIALDVHRTFAQVAILENGKIRDAGRLELEREHILKFAKRLNVEDEIVLETTVNTKAIVRLLSPHVNRVVISNPLLVRAIAWPKSRPTRSTRRFWRNYTPVGFCLRFGCQMRKQNGFVASWLSGCNWSPR